MNHFVSLYLEKFPGCLHKWGIVSLSFAYLFLEQVISYIRYKASRSVSMSWGIKRVTEYPLAIP